MRAQKYSDHEPENTRMRAPTDYHECTCLNGVTNMRNKHSSAETHFSRVHKDSLQSNVRHFIFPHPTVDRNSTMTALIISTKNGSEHQPLHNNTIYKPIYALVTAEPQTQQIKGSAFLQCSYLDKPETRFSTSSLYTMQLCHYFLCDVLSTIT